jgi:DNA-binding response OmpR family regulator
VVDRVQILEAENDQLRERIWQLEEAMGMNWAPPLEFQLSGSEATLLGVMMTKPMATKEMLFSGLYALRSDDPPEQKIIDVLICKVRKKVAPYGIVIETVWGRGYALTAESKMKIRAMLEAVYGPQ